MALRCIGVLIRKELSAGMARRLSTSATCSNFLRESPNAYLNKNILNRYTRLNYDPKYVQVQSLGSQFVY
jgi:glutamine synthetase